MLREGRCQFLRGLASRLLLGLRRLAVVVGGVALGCGSRETVPLPKRLGSVSLEASSSGLAKATTAMFYLAPEPDALALPSCWTERSGGCALWNCEEQVYAKPLELAAVSAGTVSVQGVSEPLLLEEATPGRYETPARSGGLWNGADPLTVKVAGSADFPAMDLSLHAPSLLTVSSPTVSSEKLVLSDGEDLALVWSKSGGSNVYAMLSVLTMSEEGEPIRTRVLDCNWGATTSSAVLPAALLKSLPKPPGFTSYGLDVFTAAFGDMRRGDAKLWFQATEFGLSVPMTIAAAP